MKIDVIRADDMRFLDEQARGYSQGRRQDNVLSSGVGYFFQRELEYIYARTLEAKVAPPNAFKLFSIDSSVPEGATSYTQRLMEPTGEATLIANYADDLPRVNVTRKEETRSIRMLGDSYSYSVMDIMAASMSSQPLDQDLGFAAREAIERKHNRLCWFGDQQAGLWGVLAHPYIPRFAFANPISSASTATQIIDELNDMINGVNSLSKTTASPNCLVLPPDEYAYINSTPRSPTSDTTIAAYLVANNPFLEMIEQAWECDADQNGGQKLSLAYRKDPMNARYVAPIVFRQLPVERRNLEFVVNNIASSGGFYTPRPLEMVVGELA
jgi:hypothetical protein